MPIGGAAQGVPVVLGLCATENSSFAAAQNVQARPTLCRYRRIDWNWWTNQSVGPSPGTAVGQWDTLTDTPGTNTVRAAHAAGNKVVLCAGYAPPWAGGNGVDGHNFPRDAANGYRDYANAIFVAATKYESLYPGTVIAWEIWNEPQNGFLNPISNSNYGLLLETTYKLFRTGVLLGRPNRTPLPASVQVWSGGTGAGPGRTSPNRHSTWSAALLSRPVRCLDGVDIHMYSSGCPLGTTNGYDPSWDIPRITNAIHASSWASAANPIIQINDTESGYFWRDDTTPTQSDCGDLCNCNSYGQGPNVNEKIEVTVTTAATRLKQHWDWWSANAATYPLGMSFYYQQDTTSPNNTDVDRNGNAVAAFNHAGLYAYSSNRTGAAVLDHLSKPAILNAYNATQTTPAPPTLTSLSPLTGTTAGGTTVTIVGTNLTGVTVNFGQNPATNVVVADDGLSLTCLTPAHTNPTTLHVTATNADGTSNFLTYQYLIPAPGAPTVTSVTPTSGPISGGSTFTIQGTGFSTVDPTVPSSVMFGVDAAGSITSITGDTTIKAVTPSPMSAWGRMDVTVANPSGTSTATAADQITITAPPPVFTIVAVSLDDGTVYQDFTSPITVHGVIKVAWTAVSAAGIAATWLETAALQFLGEGILAFGLYGCSYDTSLQGDGTLVIQADGRDVSSQPPASFLPITLNIANIQQTGTGFFADKFFTDYTWHPTGPVPPTVDIESAEPNPLP